MGFCSASQTASAWQRWDGDRGDARVSLHLGVGVPRRPDGGVYEGFQGALAPGAPVLVADAAAGGGGADTPASTAQSAAHTRQQQRKAVEERRKRRQEFEPRRRADVHEGGMALYTDGSMATAAGGWGLVVSRRDAALEEREMARFCGPVVVDAGARPYLGARRATNNTAELHGVAEACRHLLETADPLAARTAVLRSDSEYALDAMLGLSVPKQNKELVRRVRDLWTRARVRWRGSDGSEGLFAQHVRGHSGHRWNDIADGLAALGAQGTVRGEHSRVWDAFVRPSAPPRRPHEVVEAERVLRATHAFGVLNVPVPAGRLLAPSTVDWLHRKALGRLRAGQSASHPRRREAESRLWASRTLLRRLDQQRRVRDAVVRRPVTREVRCAVDAAALRGYVDTAGPEADVVPQHKDGASYGATRVGSCAGGCWGTWWVSARMGWGMST